MKAGCAESRADFCLELVVVARTETRPGDNMLLPSMNRYSMQAKAVSARTRPDPKMKLIHQRDRFHHGAAHYFFSAEAFENKQLRAYSFHVSK